MYLFLIVLAIIAISVFINKIVWGTKITLTEMFANFCVLLLMLAIFWWLAYKSSVSDVEILNGKVTNKTRDVVHCSHSYPCNCYTSCSGSGKGRSCSRHCQTCYRHLFDYDYVIHSTIGKFYIDRVDSQGLKEPKRYTSVKLNDYVSRTHRYSNYIKGSKTSIFHSKHNYTKKELKHFPEYPKNIYDYYYVDRVVDISHSLTSAELEMFNKKISTILSEAGTKKGVNAVIVLTNESENYAMDLIDVWYGGKKNDVVIVLGISGKKKIQYVRIHSWSLHTIFDIRLRDTIQDIGVLDIDKITHAIEQEINSTYVRRSFKEFEYLKWRILPSTLSLCIFTLVTLLISTGIGYILSKNEFN